MAMDNRSGGIFSLMSSRLGADDPSIRVPVTSSPGLSQLSPYLNFDPAYLQTSQPEFITLDGASQKRGRFELAFSQIGASCMVGGALGGAQGMYKGLLETSAAGHTNKIRTTQMINYVMKRGGASANTLGVVAVMYSGLGTILSSIRGTQDDPIDTLAAGSITGLLFKSTAGIHKCAVGGLVGLAAGAIIVGLSSRDKLKEQYGHRY